jgi:hypothetical protein
MTAKELYKTEPEFRAMIRIWARHRQCPRPLVDWLNEHDLPDMADCADWCSGRPALPPFMYGTRRKREFTYPRSRSKGCWQFWATADSALEWYHRVPIKNIKDPDNDWNHAIKGDGPTEAILALLDAWQRLPPEEPT